MDINNQVIIKCRGIILHEGKMLVAKHQKHAEYYALLGGHLEPGESPQECVERELTEELGVKPEVGKLLYVNSFEDHSINFFEFFFEIKNGKDFKDVKNLMGTDMDEISEILWISKDENVKVLPEKMFQDFKDGTLLSGEVQFIK
jgi:ADP-ribose pyrophosphatase YjhB (NUDIX family)